MYDIEFKNQRQRYRIISSFRYLLFLERKINFCHYHDAKEFKQWEHNRGNENCITNYIKILKTYNVYGMIIMFRCQKCQFAVNDTILLYWFKIMKSNIKTIKTKDNL